MRHEVEIRTRLTVGETEIGALGDTIRQLQYRVKDGAPGWLEALQALAATCERRRALQCELESLRWVLAAEAERRTGGQFPA